MRFFNISTSFYTQYTLLFDGKELNVNNHKRTLTSYGIKHGSCLNIIIHDARKAEYVTTTNDNGSVTTRLNIIDEDTYLSTLFPGKKMLRFKEGCVKLPNLNRTKFNNINH